MLKPYFTPLLLLSLASSSTAILKLALWLSAQNEFASTTEQQYSIAYNLILLCINTPIILYTISILNKLHTEKNPNIKKLTLKLSILYTLALLLFISSLGICHIIEINASFGTIHSSSIFQILTLPPIILPLIYLYQKSKKLNKSLPPQLPAT